jgi:hypothetical protein
MVLLVLFASAASLVLTEAVSSASFRCGHDFDDAVSGRYPSNTDAQPIDIGVVVNAVMVL